MSFTPVVLRKGPKYLVLFYVVLCLFACGFSGEQERPFFQISGPTMGTTYSIKALVPEGLALDQGAIKTEVDERLTRFNQVMSTYVNDSELSKLNAAPQAQWLEFSAELEEVIKISRDIYQKSKGAFDITVGPLVNLWGFGPNDVNVLPDQQVVEAALSRVGLDKVEFADGKLRKNADVYIDLSAVAKGYATDVIAGLLESKGIVDYMVEIGGEVRLRGVNQRNKAWVIGVEKPSLGREGAMIGVSGDNVAIATSGEYRNYYEKDGVRVSHTVDPNTGYPIKHRLASVTVVAETGGYADAWATAINVLGDEDGYALANTLGLAAFFIIKGDKGFETKSTPAFEHYRVTL